MDKKQRIAYLDFLRIFAFISVLIGHKFAWYFDRNLLQDPAVHGTLKVIISWFQPFYQAGGAGVIVFFLISGYIIPASLQNETTGRFVIRRIFRIYPLYWAALLVHYICIATDGHKIEWDTILLQMSLMGDFTDTPYALANVEWTLRAEIVFYIYIALLKSLGLLNRFSKFLPYVLLSTVLYLYFGPAFPVRGNTNAVPGYFSTYSPFLLAGTFFWIAEKRIASWLFSSFAVSVVLLVFMANIARYLPAYINYHYGIAALFIFVACFMLKGSFSDTRVMRELSAVTYAVYLFHNWYYEYCLRWIYAFTGMSDLYLRWAALFMLMATCYLMTKTIEEWGIKAGRFLTKRKKVDAETIPVQAVAEQTI